MPVHGKREPTHFAIGEQHQEQRKPIADDAEQFAPARPVGVDQEGVRGEDQAFSAIVRGRIGGRTGSTAAEIAA